MRSFPTTSTEIESLQQQRGLLAEKGPPREHSASLSRRSANMRTLAEPLGRRRKNERRGDPGAILAVRARAVGREMAARRCSARDYSASLLRHSQALAGRPGRSRVGPSSPTEGRPDGQTVGHQSVTQLSARGTASVWRSTACSSGAERRSSSQSPSRSSTWGASRVIVILSRSGRARGRGRRARWQAAAGGGDRRPPGGHQRRPSGGPHHNRGLPRHLRSWRGQWRQPDHRQHDHRRSERRAGDLLQTRLPALPEASPTATSWPRT